MEPDSALHGKLIIPSSQLFGFNDDSLDKMLYEMSNFPRNDWDAIIEEKLDFGLDFGRRGKQGNRNNGN